MVKTKRIPLTKLPVYPDLPNQSCFFFVADVRDVDSMRSFKHHAHNAQLMELGIMQADKEQLPLKVVGLTSFRSPPMVAMEKSLAC